MELVEVISIDGRLLLKIEPNKSEAEIQTYNLASGVYQLRIVAENKTTFIKMIVNK
jgi:hypothetical protein